MQFRNTAEHYGAVAQTLHWLIVALLLVQFTLGFIGSDLPIGMQRLIVLARHKSLGMTILALVILRLGWRFWNAPPALPASMSGIEQRLAQVSHWSLYALLLAMPVVGWLSSSASNLTVTWFGLFAFPDLVETDKALAAAAKTAHNLMARLLLVFVGIHVLAALRHHFMLRDGVLLRMLPRRSTGGPR